MVGEIFFEGGKQNFGRGVNNCLTYFGTRDPKGSFVAKGQQPLQQHMYPKGPTIPHWPKLALKKTIERHQFGMDKNLFFKLTEPMIGGYPHYCIDIADKIFNILQTIKLLLGPLQTHFWKEKIRIIWHPLLLGITLDPASVFPSYLKTKVLFSSWWKSDESTNFI